MTGTRRWTLASAAARVTAAAIVAGVTLGGVGVSAAAADPGHSHGWVDGRAFAEAKKAWITCEREAANQPTDGRRALVDCGDKPHPHDEPEPEPTDGGRR